MRRRGRPPTPDVLTPREWEVLDLLRDGLSNQEIAGRLGLSLAGAKFHVSEIISKLGVRSREEAARWQGSPAGRPALLLGWLMAHKGVALRAGLGAAGAASVAGLLVLFFLALDDKANDASGLGKLAFVRDGNLWVKDLPSGPEQRLTTGGTASSPRWSPSGEWILYQKAPPAPPGDIGLRVINADGTGDRHIGVNIGAAWSPSDDVLALTLEDSTLVLEDADGSGRREILAAVPDRDFNPLDRRLNPTWSADRRWIVFEEHHADHDRAAAYTYVGVRAVRPNGADEHEVFSALIDANGLRTGPMPAAFGGLGRGVGGGAAGYLTVRQARLTEPFDANGLPLHLFVEASRAEDGDGLRLLLYADFMDVSPEGSRIAVVEGVALAEYPASSLPEIRNFPPARDTQTAKSIAVMDLHTGSVRTLTPDGTFAVSPAWSPDGGTIAFVARPDRGPVDITAPDSRAEDGREVWAIGADGSGLRRLAADGPDCRRKDQPQWSSDGSHVLFTCLGAEDELSLWLVPAEGGGASIVAQGLSAGDLSRNPALPSYQGHIDFQPLYGWWRK